MNEDGGKHGQREVGSAQENCCSGQSNGGFQDPEKLEGKGDEISNLELEI